MDTMTDIDRSLRMLGMSTYTFTNVELKRHYLKQACRYHPDKNRGSVESTQQFQQIKEAYDLLLPHATIDDSSKPPVSEVTATQSLVLGIINVALSNPHIRDVFGSVVELTRNWSKSSSTCENECMNTLTYTIGPSITDLLCDNVYKLEVNSKTYLVPLWRRMNVYDYDDTTELIVLCCPKLPPNIYIDENNNVYVTVECKLTDRMLSENLNLELGEKKYTISTKSLCLTTQPQTICLSNYGILSCSEDVFTKDVCRSNIYVIVTLY